MDADSTRAWPGHARNFPVSSHTGAGPGSNACASPPPQMTVFIPIPVDTYLDLRAAAAFRHEGGELSLPPAWRRTPVACSPASAAQIPRHSKLTRAPTA
eukprot:366399-Chlamydomonas_euryale.AAC.37